MSQCEDGAPRLLRSTRKVLCNKKVFQQLPLLSTTDPRVIYVLPLAKKPRKLMWLSSDLGKVVTATLGQAELAWNGAYETV